MTLRGALLLSTALALTVPAAAKGKKGAAKTKEPPKKESKYISVSPEAGRHVYRFDRHGRPVRPNGDAREADEGEPQAEEAKGRKQKSAKKPSKKAARKESKYISVSVEAGRSVYRFDEHGRPVDGRPKDEKEDGKEKKDPKPQ